MKSGDKILTANGQFVTAPFANEQPCFGQRQGWCNNMATWRVEGSHLILHFCDECKALEKFKEPEYKWEKLDLHPSERSLSE